MIERISLITQCFLTLLANCQDDMIHDNFAQVATAQT